MGGILANGGGGNLPQFLKARYAPDQIHLDPLVVWLTAS